MIVFDWVGNHWNDVLMVAFSGLLVLFTGLLWYVSRKQAEILGRSLDVAKESADAAKISADAARISADVARSSLTVLERPYLYVAQLGLNVGPNVFDAAFVLQNYGRTPAIIRTIHVLFDIRQEPLKEFAPAIALPQSLVVGAGEQTSRISCRSQTSVGQGVAGQLERKELFFWLSCTVTYEDMFSQVFETKSLWRLDWRSRQFQPFSA